ncbi:hypothetical protein A7X67_11130 [Clostridium sp. W14A]|nr:hypothetical protein A7X67_11130 [Clostridium sp. W14A]
MIDKDYLKGILEHYETPQAKEYDISNTILMGQNELNRLVRSKTPLMELILDQLKYISPLLWASQLLAIILIVILSANLKNPYIEVRQILFEITPLLSLFAVPELIKSAVYGMSELENTCKNSASKVLTARLIVIGGVNLMVITIMTATMSNQYDLPFLHVIIYGLIPFNIVNGLNLVIFDLFKVRSSFIAIAVSLGSAVIVNASIYFRSFYAISEIAWIILFWSTAVLLLIEIYRFLHTMANKEEYIQWS